MRIFKTRSDAADAAEKGHVSIQGVVCKPSRQVKIGDVIFVKKAPVTYQYKVLMLTDKRQSASLVSQYVEDLTPESETDKLVMNRVATFGIRDRGTGRPTKKDRRSIDDFTSSL